MTRGWTLEVIAHYAHVATSTVCKWEQGYGSCTRVLWTYVRLGYTPELDELLDYIIGGIDDEHPAPHRADL